MLIDRGLQLRSKVRSRKAVAKKFIGRLCF
jgi:hypothetical protein